MSSVQSSAQERGQIYTLAGESVGDDSRRPHRQVLWDSAQKVMEQPAHERRVSTTNTWEEAAGRETSMCKGPEAPENMH